MFGVAVVVVACTSPKRRPARNEELQPWQLALQGKGSIAVSPLTATTVALPSEAQAAASTVFVVDADWRAPDQVVSEARRAELLAFVQAGGRLVLFGYAASLAAQLGIEPEVPEQGPFRWGFDGRTALGRARLGLRVVSGRCPELFLGLTPAEPHEFTFLLTGGEPCTVPLCSWSIGVPKQGEVLALLAAELDGSMTDRAEPVFVRWRVGRGEVLACGLVPDLAHPDALVQQTAHAFVRHCAGDTSPHTIVVLDASERCAREAAVPSTADMPMAPLLAHWGWQARLSGELGARSAEEVVHEALLPSWLAGADLLELDVADAERGVPFAWSTSDPLKRPESWRQDASLPAWDAAAIGRLANESHARGMLLQAVFDPLPVGERATERLVALRFLARELACVRRLGSAAIDGFGVRQWWADASGYGSAMVQDFHPGAFVYSSGEQVPPLVGGLRAADADDGAPRGLGAAGLSAQWRDGFAADLFPLGVLDARANRDRTAPGHVAGGVAGGGSHADWIVTQANDFVREHRGLGGAMWWRHYDPRTLDVDSAAYVNGISLEPLRAAVAMSLAATGRDGYRAAAAGLLDPVQRGFGAEVGAPAAVHVLQNNWFRLLGSGGSLLFDPSGLARFRAGEATALSPAFVRTRLSGGRPDSSLLRAEGLDLRQAGTRGEGGFGRTAWAGPRSEEPLLPAVLAADEQPTWPAAVAIEWAATAGYHELEVQPRGVRGFGILALSVDGVVQRCVPFRTGERADVVTLPVHVGSPGMRTLQLEVVEGGAVAIDRLRLARTGDIGAEARVVVPAGSLARLRERSHSSFHSERVELTTLADFPGFLISFACDHAVRNLQVERLIALPGYRELAAGPTEGAGGLQQPFVLRASDASAPDVVVVPLQMARNDRLSFASGELTLRSAPEAGLQSRFGFLVCQRKDSEAWRPHAARLLADIDRPQTLPLGDRGEAVLLSQVPLAHTRLVHLSGPATTPFLVRENGWWLWRGSQPAPEGGSWLRVWQAPGDAVQIVGGPAVLARTRPGPGSLRLLALKDPEPLSATVRVLQPSRLCAPSVVLAADFDTVRLDGEPWAWFDGRRVFLPDRPGTYRLEASRHAGAATPRVRCTRAPLQRCFYAPAEHELVLVTASDPTRPPELPWTAVLVGPRPARIENGEIVDEASLRHADAELAAAARAGGVLVRFRSGTTRVFYE
ncbi:MAG: DUF4350 domain-containing protein [Planctomycetota bacterium]